MEQSEEKNDPMHCALCAEKDRTISALQSQIADKNEIIRLLRLEQPTAQSSADVSDAAAG